MDRTRLLSLLAPLVFAFVAGCPPPPEISYSLSNVGDELVLVQGPDGDDMPLLEVLVDGEWLAAMRAPEIACLRACGPTTTEECIQSEVDDYVGFAVAAGETVDYVRGRVWYRTEDARGVCLEQLQGQSDVRLQACWSTEAEDGAGDPVEVDELGLIHADWAPLGLVDPTCETVEFGMETVGQVEVGAPVS